MKTIKVIELLNKMYMGEKVPKKIDYITHYNETLEWCDLCKNYEVVIDGERKTLFEVMDSLQDDLLIIEDSEEKRFETMTFERLNFLIEKYNIPKDVHLMSDSGWECWETEMCGAYYNKKENKIVFTQSINEYSKYDKRFKNHEKGYIALI